MPKTKAQGILFGLIMSYSMAIGMEIYNTASALGFAQQLGGLSNLRSAVFLPALRETLCMGLIVFIVSNLWGNRIGAENRRRRSVTPRAIIRRSAVCCVRPERSRSCVRRCA